jgi:hypothetical protein
MARILNCQDVMKDQEFVALLDERIEQIARDVIQAIIHDSALSHASGEAYARLREQLELIKVKEHVTVKEVALLLSCSQSHIRKLVTMARKGKSRRPIPFVDMEGVTVFLVKYFWIGRGRHRNCK